MIKKYYTLYCDKCGDKVHAWETSSIEKAVRLEKRYFKDTKITKRLNGAYYIECAYCQKEKDNKWPTKKYLIL